VVKDELELNAPSFIREIDLGKVILLKAVHPEKEKEPINVIPSGIVTDCKFLQLKNIRDDICVIPAGQLTAVKPDS